jgi:hypothetical protein
LVSEIGHGAVVTAIIGGERQRLINASRASAITKALMRMRFSFDRGMSLWPMSPFRQLNVVKPFKQKTQILPKAFLPL